MSNIAFYSVRWWATWLFHCQFSLCVVLELLQPLRWCCVDCVIHHERDVRKEQQYIYVVRTNNSRAISSGDLYCCLLLQCEALRTCRSGFPIAAESTVSGHTFSSTSSVCLKCFRTKKHKTAAIISLLSFSANLLIFLQCFCCTGSVRYCHCLSAPGIFLGKL